MQRAANAAGKDQPCRVKLRIWRFHPPPPAPPDGSGPSLDAASISSGGASGSGALGSGELGSGEQGGAHARQHTAAARRAGAAGAGSDASSGSNPGAAPAPKRFRQLEGAAALLTIQDAVLCSEMGVQFSPCGRYLAACVACRVRALAHTGGSLSKGQHHHCGLAIRSGGCRVSALMLNPSKMSRYPVGNPQSEGLAMACR